MRGHEPIIAMRERGRRPTMLRLELRPFPRRIPGWSIPEDMVFIEPDDLIPALDLRFVIGCLVMVNGQDEKRVRDLFSAAQDHGAQRVIAHLVAPAPRGTFDLIQILDTEGVLTHGTHDF